MTIEFDMPKENGICSVEEGFRREAKGEERLCGAEREDLEEDGNGQSLDCRKRHG